MLRGVAAAKDVQLWYRRWLWYERNALPWNRARIHWHMARRRAFIRFPVQGNVLECLDDGRLDIGPHTLLEPGCWITIGENAHISIGEGCFLNLNTMLAAIDRIEIGDHVMFANHCFVGDAGHKHDDPDVPITWQGFESKGPVKIGSNCWFGVNCVVTSGVTIGDRCVIGSNSVVTKDLSPGVVAAGAPAKVLREIDFKKGARGVRP
jgi:acetyltransferase-like isoleucine patch superfamily enzyme